MPFQFPVLTPEDMDAIQAHAATFGKTAVPIGPPALPNGPSLPKSLPIVRSAPPAIVNQYPSIGAGQYSGPPTVGSLTPKVNNHVALQQHMLNVVKSLQSSNRLLWYLKGMDPNHIAGMMATGDIKFDANGGVVPTPAINNILRAKQAAAMPGLKAAANAPTPSIMSYFPAAWNEEKTKALGAAK